MKSENFKENLKIHAGGDDKQRIQFAPPYLYTSKSIYIVTNFHASGELHWGSEFSYNYIINYLIIT